MRGPGDNATVDGVPEVHVAVHRAEGLQVAQGGEAGHQILLRIGERRQRAVLVRVAQDLVVKIGPVAEDVSVSIDQAGQDRGVSQVDHLGAGRHLHSFGRAHFHNAISLDQDDLIGRELFSSVKKAPGTYGNPVIRR